MDKITVVDNFLSLEEINSLTNYFQKNQKNATEFYNTITLQLEFNNFLSIKKKHESVAGFKIDWGQIVLWPKYSKQQMHFDTAKPETQLTSITYLNNIFKGGKTVFEDGIDIDPILNRSLFFNGQKYKHGVSLIEEGIRLTLAIWYI